MVAEVRGKRKSRNAAAKFKTLARKLNRNRILGIFSHVRVVKKRLFGR